ncbi:Uncharacterised protein [Pseudomonas putida]|nr:Uncharacterised protein [Pseudomonas putida]BBV97969.1 hypothetical protein STW0522PSE72_33200 [Pseudomonas monteilii]CAB5587846.1 Uncharacterised protein [Pseudomonas putida]CAB5628671.1 Uncharacterised protein [Pseudomonas putida]CAB5629132.1 Uncharacterised protein [Pseudomonas putida]
MKRIREFVKAFKWKLAAYSYMRSRIGWARWDMVSSLYENFSGWDPRAAVEEDLSYWG